MTCAGRNRPYVDGMKRSFRFFATWVAITGLLMGAAFGAGKATEKDAPADTGTGLTAQQVQQLLNTGSGAGTNPNQQGPGGAVIIGGPGGGPGG